MARQLDLPLVYEGHPAHLLVEPCQRGGWDVTLSPAGGSPGIHIHCRNWQRVERFRLRLLADYGRENPATRPQAIAKIATLFIASLLNIGPARAHLPAGAACQPDLAQAAASYHLEPNQAGDPRTRFSDEQIALLEKLNRADRDHLAQLPELVVPDQWVPREELYSPLPRDYAGASGEPKLLVVYLPGQLFGAYEFGRLVRWGPLSSGARPSPTPNGLYALNWKSTGHASSVDPDWFMPWYFNFGNREGLAFHEYVLPGRPASHGCIRLLRRDAQWLFEWGDEWGLDASRTRILTAGTAVFIVGTYNYHAAPPWRSIEWLARGVDLPMLPIDEDRRRNR